MTPIVLASKSASRAEILRAAGIDIICVGSGVDEDEPKQRLVDAGVGPRDVALHLATLKALAVSSRVPGLVIGADQTLDLDGILFDKADTVGQARERLLALRGRRHQLHAAVVVAKDGRELWSTLQSASLEMRSFSDAFLDAYLHRQGRDILSSVGCYQLEGEGAQLFSAVDGDYFTVLGLPLWDLLAYLRDAGALMA